MGGQPRSVATENWGNPFAKLDMSKIRRQVGLYGQSRQLNTVTDN